MLSLELHQVHPVEVEAAVAERGFPTNIELGGQDVNQQWESVAARSTCEFSTSF